MKMKRWIGCLCVAMLVLGMSACSKSADEDKSADDGQKTEQVETEQKTDVDLSEVYTGTRASIPHLLRCHPD